MSRPRELTNPRVFLFTLESDSLEDLKGIAEGRGISVARLLRELTKDTKAVKAAAVRAAK